MRTVEDELARLLPTGPIVGNVATGLALGRSAAVHEVHDMLEELGLAKAVVLSPPAPGGPCYVVTREAWERFVCSCDDIGCNTKDEVLALFRDEANSHWMEQAEEHWKAAEASASVVATALLGSVRMAKAVTRWAGGYRLVDDFKQEDMVEVHDGDTVAVLEDK